MLNVAKLQLYSKLFSRRPFILLWVKSICSEFLKNETTTKSKQRNKIPDRAPHWVSLSRHLTTEEDTSTALLYIGGFFTYTLDTHYVWPDRILAGASMTQSEHFYYTPLSLPLQFISANLLHSIEVSTQRSVLYVHLLLGGTKSLQQLRFMRKRPEAEGEGHSWEGHTLSPHWELGKVFSSPQPFQGQLHAWMTTAA